MVSVCAPVADNSATRSPGLGATRLHFRKQHRRDRGHVGGLRARDAGHQIHRRDQHIVQAAAHMAEQVCQKGDHGARHAGHLDEQAEKDEQRHRQQDEMAHALVHAPDQDHQRRMRRQRQIAEDGKAERECDRHAGKDGRGDDADEENQQVQITELPKHRRGKPECSDDYDDGTDRNQDRTQGSGPGNAKEREQCHQRDSARQGGGAPGVVQAERRRGDEGFFLGVLISRPRDQQQERKCGAGRE